MTTHLEVVIVWDRVALWLDIHQRPAAVSEVHWPRRELVERLGEVHPLVEVPRIADPQRVGDVEEQALADGEGLLIAPVCVEVQDRVEEVDGERGGPDQHVALSADQELSLGRIGLHVLEVVSNRRLRRSELRREGLGDHDRLFLAGLEQTAA